MIEIIVNNLDEKEAESHHSIRDLAIVFGFSDDGGKAIETDIIVRGKFPKPNNEDLLRALGKAAAIAAYGIAEGSMSRISVFQSEAVKTSSDLIAEKIRRDIEGKKGEECHTET